MATVSPAVRPRLRWRIPESRAALPRRLAHDGLALVGVACAVALLSSFISHPVWFTDAREYWAVDRVMPYGGVLGEATTFTYSPPMALAFVLLGHLPQQAFLGLWLALNAAIVAWLVRPRPWVALVLAAPILDSLISGQVELLMTAAIVLAFRGPAVWALPLLTKSTTGVGLIWFVVRREWARLAVAVGLTASLAALSYVLEPGWWSAWADFIARSSGNLALPLRVVGAAGIVAWGGRSGRSWSVIVAATLALPVIYIHSLAMLIGASYLMPSVGSLSIRLRC